MSRLILVSATTFVLGAVAAAALLVLNPFAAKAQAGKPLTASDSEGNVVERFIINAPADIVAVTHNGTNMILPTPSDIAMFSEAAVSSGLVLVAKVRNENEEIVGFAIESEVADANNNLLLGKIRMHTDWTIVIPGRGTIFATQIEDSGSIGMDIIPTVMTGGEWSGDVEFVSTVGPDASGRGLVIGGTMEFEGVTGAFVEVTHLRRMSQAKGGVGVFELQLSYRKP